MSIYFHEKSEAGRPKGSPHRYQKRDASLPTVPTALGLGTEAGQGKGRLYFAGQGHHCLYVAPRAAFAGS